MTDIVNIPEGVLSSDFPTNADRTADVFNQKSYDWAVSARAMSARDREIAVAGRTNALAATEKAQAAAGSATAADGHANRATAQADAAMGYRDTASTHATTATTQAGIATTKAGEAAASASQASVEKNLAQQAVIDAAEQVGLAAEQAVRAEEAAASIADGPVTSVGGATGVVSLKTINGLSIVGDGNIEATPDAVRRPINTSPAQSATVSAESPALVGSAYLSLYGLAMAASQWQVSTVADFATTVVSTGDIAGTATTYTVPAGILIVSTAYYWRVRYKDAEGIYSAWSAPTSFTTAALLNSYIATPAATPANFGSPFEGGFYTGMIWNQLVQSATSTAIGTGTKTFTVPSMAGAPIVYAGQQLEVRSRANPANKMIGVVTGAVDATLTLNITSVGGSGTFTDWSIMSRYRVVVAPKASGENAALAWRDGNYAGPAATGTLTEGRKATLAMVAAGTSTLYPAAHWCNNLSIGGKTDWYLPARDELELCWRNLKPVTNENYATANRPADATPNYQNLGSFGGTEAAHGLNKNSAPAGAAYTSVDPAQTAAAAFKTGGVEAYEFGSAFYWSSSEYSASNAWSQHWSSSTPGFQSSNSKTSSFRVRAVRRSII